MGFIICFVCYSLWMCFFQFSPKIFYYFQFEWESHARGKITLQFFFLLNQTNFFLKIRFLNDFFHSLYIGFVLICLTRDLILFFFVVVIISDEFLFFNNNFFLLRFNTNKLQATTAKVNKWKRNHWVQYIRDVTLTYT